MKILSLFLFPLCMVCIVNTLPIISKPLENNPDHLIWEATIDNTHSSDDKTRKIAKSIFITPNLNESKGQCPPDHKLGPEGKCFKTLQIDQLWILKTQIASLFKKNQTSTTVYEDDYDYSEYGESSGSSSEANIKYTLPLSLYFVGDRQPQPTPSSFPLLNRVTKDDSHAGPTTADDFESDDTIQIENTSKPFLVSTTGTNMGSKEPTSQSNSESSTSGRPTASSLLSSMATTTEPFLAITPSALLSSSSPSSESKAHEMGQTVTVATEAIHQNATVINSTIKSQNLTTMASSPLLTEQTSTESDKLDVSVSTPGIITTTIDTRSLKLSDGAQLTTESIPDNVTKDSEFESEALGEMFSATESSELTLESLSQMIPEIDEILLDLSDKNPDFIGKYTVPDTNEKHARKSIGEQNARLNEPLIKPTTQPAKQIAQTTEPSVLPVQTATDEYEMIDAFFIPSISERSDSFEGEEIDEKTNRTFSQPRYRLENSSLISDEELLALDNTTFIDDEHDQQTDIELIRKNESSPSTDESIEQTVDNENISLRLAEESFFQGSTVMMNDEDSDVKPTNETTQSDDTTSNIKRAFVDFGDDDITTNDPSSYDAIESSFPADIPKTVHHITDQPASVYSTFMSRLKVTPPPATMHDFTESPTQHTEEPLPMDEFIDRLTHMGTVDTNPATTTTIEPNPPLIVKQPPNHGKSL